MYYAVHGDMNSGSHIGSLLFWYLHRFIKCPCGLTCWFHIRAPDMIVLNSCVNVIYVYVLKRKKSFKSLHKPSHIP
jgi:hypothetical protein